MASLRQGICIGRLVFLGWPLALVGCSDDERADSLDLDGQKPGGEWYYYEDTRPKPADDLAWSRCDLNTDSETWAGVAECATTQVPARRDVDSARTFTLSLKRYRPVAEPRGQLWLVDGGPGASTSTLESALSLFIDVAPDLELYLLDHRGTGRSTPLRCPPEEASVSESGSSIAGDEWSSCGRSLSTSYGEDLAGFNVTEAATDLGELMARTRHGLEPVFVYSVSYGTYLLQRFLQLYPDLATGIVLDSICSPGSCELLLNFDRAFDATARQILALCGKDATCSQHLGPDPYTRLVAVANSLDSGHCSELGWSRETFRQVLGFLIMNVGLRDYTPALIKRVERCSSNDLASLDRFTELVQSFATEGTSFSQPLQTHIILAELSQRPLPTTAEIEANVASLYASLDAGPRMAGALAAWPIYPSDEYVGKFASTTTPLLMLNGDMDPQTPLEVALPTAEHFIGDHQRFIQIPRAAHTTLAQSPIDAQYHNCGAELIRQFYVDPTATLDESCVNRVLPIDFSGSTELTKAMFGTLSAWEDTAPGSLSAQSGALLARRRPLRRIHLPQVP